jgi:polysaccharide deacetylase 2 family uncharacterized protein YibQ
MRKLLASSLVPVAVVGSVLGAGYGLQLAFGDSFSASLSDSLAGTSAPVAPDTLVPARPPLHEALYQKLGVLKRAKARGKGDSYRPEEWTLPNGKALPGYALDAQRVVESYGAEVVSMEERRAQRERPGIRLIYQDSVSSHDLMLRLSDSTYAAGSSHLAPVLRTRELTGDLVRQLNALDFPVTLLVQPWMQDQGQLALLDQIQRKEVVAWIPMESRLLTNDSMKHTLQIVHTPKQVQDLIADALRRLPEATGIATRNGDRLVEQEGVLGEVVQAVSQRGLWFLDITDTRLSRTNELCLALHANCERQPYSSAVLPADAAQNALKNARRTGHALLVLPLSAESLSALSTLSASAKTQGTDIVTGGFLAEKY